LEYVKLDNTDLLVSRFGFGCEPAGGTDWGKVDDHDSIVAIRRAVDLGVNFFDTADVYGLGRSEQILAEALGPDCRKVIIASKFGVNWNVVPGNRARTFFDSSPARLLEALEGSLRRLRLDCIPLYYIHWPDPKTPIADTVEALIKCKEAGKIRYIGVSNFSSEQIRQAHAVHSLATVQVPYNLLQRQAESDVLPCCDELGIRAVAYGPLAQGLLTGKYGADAKFDSDDRRSRLSHFQKETLKENLASVERLEVIGKQYEKKPAQVAIRWILDNPSMSCAIIGIKNAYQLEENLGAMNWTLAPEAWKFLTGE
jgi:aryl-alcohol dehydrogenase-like predicted oxidoreductase